MEKITIENNIKDNYEKILKDSRDYYNVDEMKAYLDSEIKYSKKNPIKAKEKAIKVLKRTKVIK